LSGAVVEGYLGSGLAEEANRGGSDATGASGDESDLVLEGKWESGHGTSVSRFAITFAQALKVAFDLSVAIKL
jgi:hypothetical protein